MKRPTPPAVGVTEEAGTTVLRLGPYRLGETLGQGGMGVVYRAERVETGARVAVKTARDSSEMAVSSIRREIEILEQLDHPGVISLVDHGSVDGVPWLAMELLDGSTLFELVGQTTENFDSHIQLAAPQTTGGARAHQRLFDGPGSAELAPPTPRPLQFEGVRRSFDLDGLRPVLEVLRRLCHTLGYLHSEGVVHGDLKPSNVSLRVDGTPVLVDFGVTALFEGGHSRDRILAHDSRPAGTVQYMAPEQFRGQFVDARADLYALGCMLYLVVTAQLPFRASSPESIVSNHLDGEYRPPGELVDGLPDELDALISRLLAAEPDRRLGHADVVADRLGALLGVDEQTELDRQHSRSHHLHKPAFVGQQQLLEGLLGSLHDVGNFMLIGGRAGIGKTRVAREFAARAERTRMRVTLASADVGTSAADPTGHAPPLWAFRTTLRAVADRCRELGEAETARVIGRRAAVLAQYEPALAGLDGGLGDAELVELPARAARTRVLTYLTETLVAFAAERPLLIIIDDLHLADELSLEFIADALRSGGLEHVTIAATYRLEHRARVAPVLAHEHTRSFQIDALDDEAVASLVSDMLALPNPPADFVEMVVAESGGNPFVVSEYVHAAVEQGLLARGADGSWQVETREPGRSESGRPLSASGRLQSLIGGRLERLAALTHRSAGEVEAAADLLEVSLAKLGYPLPATSLQWGMCGA
ncbi:MAG: serine/threonine protein kinase, partial [Persicimonas sp.]